MYWLLIAILLREAGHPYLAVYATIAFGIRLFLFIDSRLPNTDPEDKLYRDDDL